MDWDHFDLVSWGLLLVPLKVRRIMFPGGIRTHAGRCRLGLFFCNPQRGPDLKHSNTQFGESHARGYLLENLDGAELEWIMGPFSDGRTLQVAEVHCGSGRPDLDLGFWLIRTQRGVFSGSSVCSLSFKAPCAKPTPALPTCASRAPTQEPSFTHWASPSLRNRGMFQHLFPLMTSQRSRYVFLLGCYVAGA